MTTRQPIAERLHDDLHKIPGMPAHEQAEVLNSNARAARRHSERHAAPKASLHAKASRNSAARHNDPKVLVAWQQFIGRLVHRGTK